jgi:hypothetical protein
MLGISWFYHRREAFAVSMPDIYPDKLPDIKLLSLANELLFSIHEFSFFSSIFMGLQCLKVYWALKIASEDAQTVTRTRCRTIVSTETQKVSNEFLDERRALCAERQILH